MAEVITSGTDVLGLLNVFDVKAYGATGDGTTDDYARIMAAYNAIPATGGTLLFPAGRFLFNTALVFSNPSTRPIAIVGAGAATVLVPGFASGDAITLSASAGSTRVSVANLHIEPSVARDQTAYNLSLVSVINGAVTNVTMENALGGGLYQFDTCTFLKVSNCQGRSSTAAAGVALRVKNCNGTPHFANSRFETANGATGYTGCKPALHVTGTVTGLKFANVGFVGAGPRSQFAVSGVVSDVAKFTVTTTAAHDFRVGDFAVLRGMTPAAYNSQWRVATVPTSTTFTVTTTLNPGPSTVNGTAESVTACGLVTNEDAGTALSVNEAAFTGCLFEASQAGLYGSAALYFDGRRGVLTQQGSLSGWTLTGNYYDQYATGLLLSGMSSNAANEATVNGFSIAGGVFNARCRAVHLDQVQGIAGSDLIACVPGSVTPIDDGVSFSTGLYIYAGPSAPFAQGIQFTNSQFGPGRNWQNVNNTAYFRAAILDSPGIQDLILTNNHFFGRAASPNGGVTEINSPLAATNRWTIKDNQIGSGTFPPTAAALIPTVASATAITLTNIQQDKIIVSGVTNIQTINVGWIGRELRLLFTGALSLVTGGNLAIAANRTVLAGDLVTLAFDGTSWYVR